MEELQSRRSSLRLLLMAEMARLTLHPRSPDKLKHGELISLIAMGESETLELKKTTGELHEGMKSLCGMANRRGGKVIFGVLPSAQRPIEERLRGQDVSERTLETIANEIRKFEPPISPDIEQIRLETGGGILVLTIPGGGGPYVYDGRPYKRTTASTSIMPQAEYDRLLTERCHPKSRWEIQAAVGVSLADLDANEITTTVEEAIRRGRLDEPGTRDSEKLLRGLGLLRNDELTNAAVALFARDHALPLYYPQCVLRMARFSGSDKSEFIDNRQEAGNAFTLYQRAQRFMRDHLPIAGRILPGVYERRDDPIYPPEALREALANAIIHRDYAVGGGSISLAIYADRLEITSVGPLPFGQTTEDLFRDHTSRPWNPSMAKVFYLRGLIETWGRVTLKMAELSKNAGLVRPEIAATARDVTVTFFPLTYVAPFDVKHNLSELQRRLLGALSGKPLGRSLSEIRDELGDGIPHRTLQNNLRLLKELDLVDLSGRGRGSVWYLK
jgi:ATP-dependent DNA helicase RecG